MMKKIISTLILGTLCFSTVPPVLSQRKMFDGEKTLVVKKDLFAGKRALTEGQGVWLEWQTGNEAGFLGFRVYRLTDGKKEAVSETMLSGQALTAGGNVENGNTYNFFDPQGAIGTIYVIEAVSEAGTSTFSGKFSADYTADLKPIAGQTGADLLRATSQKSETRVTKDELVLPPDYEPEQESQLLAADDPGATQRWVASQPGVKISISADGFYKVTKAQLQAVGFDTSGSSTNWQMYLNGVEQAINVAANNDFIEFYGQSINITETASRVYYLVNGTSAGKRIGSTVLRTLNNKVTNRNFRQTTLHRNHVSYINQILNGDNSNFFGYLVSSSGGTTNFNLSGVDTTAGTARLEVNVQGLSLVAHQTRVVLNDVELGFVTGANRDLMTNTFEIPATLLREGQNVLKLTSSGSSDTSFTENIRITYNRLYSATGDQLSFYTANYRGTRIGGFSSSDVRVFDMSDPSNIKKVDNLRVESNGSTFDAVIPSSRARVLYAVGGAAVSTVASSAISANVPSTISASSNAASMVIISYKDWMTQANNWATYRRNDGLTVKVVDVEDVYDEFGYGLPTGDSIKAFLNYARSNWATAPRYVFLIGDASYDPRAFFNLGNSNYVPTRMVDTTYMETGSDDALVDFDGDGLGEMAIGRIPVRDAQNVTDILAKTTAFEQGLAQAFTRGGLFVSDLPDGYDFQAMSNRLVSILPPSMPILNVNRASTDARTQIMDSINNGRYLINYTGHGTFAAWAGSILHRSDVALMTNTNANLNIANMLTCLNGYFVDPSSSDGLTEAMVKKSTGGAAIGWASTGLTTPDVQEIMAARFYSQLNNSTTMRRMGDFVVDAKASIGGGRDVRLSWALLGDPALKIK